MTMQFREPDGREVYLSALDILYIVEAGPEEKAKGINTIVAVKAPDTCFHATVATELIGKWWDDALREWRERR
jgi:hypothetical protein